MCGGGGGDTIDKEYNRRMAAIAEAQSGMAQQYFNFWKTDYRPLEREQIQANRELLPYQTGLAKLNMAAQSKDIQNRMHESELAKPVMTEFYKEALRGTDENAAVNEARADVAGAFKEQEGQLRREAGRMGLNPNSNKFATGMGAKGLNQARATASAMTGARQNARTENFNKLASATQAYKAGLPSIGG